MNTKPLTSKAWIIPAVTTVLLQANCYGFGGKAQAVETPPPKCAVESKKPSKDSCYRFHPHGDFLYWQANEDGLEYGTKMVGGSLIGTPSTLTTRLLDVDFQWDPGFRIGFGYTFDSFDCWNLDINWTHIRNYAHGKTRATGIESQTGEIDTIISPWVNLLFELRAGASKASAHWNVDYNTLDLVLGRSLLLSKRFTLSPYFGLRGAFIDQTYDAYYASIFLSAENSPRTYRQVIFKGNNDFSAFGLRAGTELLFQISKHWQVFSRITGNLMYGRFSVEMQNLNDQGLGEGSIPPNFLDFYASESFWRTRLNFEESLGIGWVKAFRCKPYVFSLRASYELSQWLDQNQLFYTLYFRGQDTISSVPIRNQGNLSFQGVQISASFQF